MQRANTSSKADAGSPTKQEPSVVEQVEASIKGEDEPMEKVHPTATAAMVWFAYPLALIALVLIGFAILAYLR